MYISIAIDGPAGSGKSTITKKLAKDLDFNYVDTGALYRALTYTFLENNLKEIDELKIQSILKNTNIKVYFENFKQKIVINDIDVTEKIRTAEISKYTSLFATSSEVRLFLIDIQRNLAKNCNVIMDGRDIASVVLPNANHKFYLTASVDERAKRRYNELVINNDYSLTFDEIKKAIEKRDYQDINRKIAPLIKTSDAIEIDTTNYSINEVIEILKKYILKK